MVNDLCRYLKHSYLLLPISTGQRSRTFYHSQNRSLSPRHNLELPSFRIAPADHRSLVNNLNTPAHTSSAVQNPLPPVTNMFRTFRDKIGIVYNVFVGLTVGCASYMIRLQQVSPEKAYWFQYSRHPPELKAKFRRDSSIHASHGCTYSAVMIPRCTISFLCMIAVYMSFGKVLSPVRKWAL